MTWLWWTIPVLLVGTLAVLAARRWPEEQISSLPDALLDDHSPTNPDAVPMVQPLAATEAETPVDGVIDLRDEVVVDLREPQPAEATALPADPWR